MVFLSRYFSFLFWLYDLSDLHDVHRNWHLHGPRVRAGVATGADGHGGGEKASSLTAWSGHVLRSRTLASGTERDRARDFVRGPTVGMSRASRGRVPRTVASRTGGASPTRGTPRVVSPIRTCHSGVLGRTVTPDTRANSLNRDRFTFQSATFDFHVTWVMQSLRACRRKWTTEVDDLAELHGVKGNLIVGITICPDLPF